jgi:Family of unknown function (DUF6364)
MANLTVSVDAEVLKQARIRALENGTSVNELVGKYLEDYVQRRERQKKALLAILESAKTSTYRGGEKWTREELYERGK